MEEIGRYCGCGGGANRTCEGGALNVSCNRVAGVGVGECSSAALNCEAEFETALLPLGTWARVCQLWTVLCGGGGKSLSAV